MSVSVNPKLATLMRVIDDNQDKITEGEYLEAMNALAALHRDESRESREQAQAQAQHAGAIRPIPIPGGGGGGVVLLQQRVPEVMRGNIACARGWERVQKYHPDPFVNRMSAEQWMQAPYEDQFRLVREATEYQVAKIEEKYRTPEPSVCPFITRHAVGLWNMDHDGERDWECVCGYTGKVKNWKRHEESERHQDWAKHRIVSRRRIEKMKGMQNDDDVGNVVQYAIHGSRQHGLYPGGIRMYTVWQDKNEWTHPELYPEIHRSPKPTVGANGSTSTTWFVHPRELLARAYVE